MEQRQALLETDEDAVSHLEAQQLGQEIMERDRDIHTLVGDTVEMQQVAADIAALIEEQGGAVDQVAVTIQDVAHNIDRGTEQLERARSRQRRFRMDLCSWICVVLGVVCGLYVGFLLP
jgi:t-SNARE complex subunit (syntaxin)